MRLLASPAALALAITAGTAVAGGTSLAVATPAQATTVSTPLRSAVAGLPVAGEVHTGYQRSAFRLWVDADHDSCDTREEVLLAESLVRARRGAGCTVLSGRWISSYDHRTFTNPSSLDIDHLVPLSEAWDSGARRWTASTRERYANDLSDPRTLVAVSATTNRSKGDRDPAQWMPRYDRCSYVDRWVAVKVRWRLTVDTAEKRALTAQASRCPNVTLRVTRASIATTAATAPTSTSSAQLTRVVYDAPGIDTSATANGEQVVVKNTGRRSLALGGWRLRDATNHWFTFPTLSVLPGRSVTIHSGKGRNTATNLYAGWNHVWNNTGDTATLSRTDGSTADRCSWGNGPGYTTC